MKHQKIDRTKWKKAGAIFLVVTLIFASFYWFSVKRPFMEAEERLPEGQEDYIYPAYQLKQGKGLAQQLPAEGGLCGSWVKLSAESSTKHTALRLELLDENKNLLQAKEVPLYKAAVDTWYPVSFGDNIPIAGQNCFLKLSLVGGGEDTKVFLYGKTEDGAQKLKADGADRLIAAQDAAMLPYRAQFGAFRIERNFLLLIYLTTLLWSIGILVFRPSAVACFLILAITQSVLFQVILPPSSAPDEHTHFATAYEKSNRLLHYHEDEKQNGYYLPARPQDAYVTRHFLENYLNRTTYEYYDAIGQEKAAVEEAAIEIYFLEGETWLMHLPAILGITLARLLHMSGFGMLFLGRAFMSAAYIAMAAYGIRKMPVHPYILALIASFPMCLHLANSYSYDSVLLGFAFLFIGEVFYLAFQKEKLHWYNGLFLLVAAVLFLKVKMIYVLLLGLCALIPLKKILPASVLQHKNKKALYGGIAAAVLVAAAVAAAVLAKTLPFLLGEYYRATGVDTFTYHHIFTDFPGFIWRSLNTLRFESSWYWVTMVGARLGWLDIVIPDALAFGALGLVLLAGCRVRGEAELPLKTWHRGWMLGTAATILLAMLAVAMCWSSLYRQSFWGMQGRYLLPALPVLMTAVSGQKWITLEKDISHSLMILMGSVNVLALIHAYLIIASR